MKWDKPAILNIENESFEDPWLEEEFDRVLEFRHVMLYVAEYEDQVVGYSVFELLPNIIHVLNFAVHHRYRRLGVGSQMVAQLLDHLSWQCKWRIMLEIRETNLQAQLFFKHNGFRAIQTLRDYYGGTTDDAYVFHHCLERTLKNRISRWFPTATFTN